MPLSDSMRVSEVPPAVRSSSGVSVCAEGTSCVNTLVTLAATSPIETGWVVLTTPQYLAASATTVSRVLVLPLAIVNRRSGGEPGKS